MRELPPEGETPAPMSRTPSGFYSAARFRKPGHDEMQAQLLAFLRRRPLTAIPAGAAVHREVIAEMPLLRRGEIFAFADATEILHINLTCLVSMFEIKPSIDSVFACIRQAKALSHMAKRQTRADLFTFHFVVSAADPLLPELRKEWPTTWAWGATFQPEIDHERC